MTKGNHFTKPTHVYGVALQRRDVSKVPKSASFGELQMKLEILSYLGTYENLNDCRLIVSTLLSEEEKFRDETEVIADHWRKPLLEQCSGQH